MAVRLHTNKQLSKGSSVRRLQREVWPDCFWCECMSVISSSACHSNKSKGHRSPPLCSHISSSTTGLIYRGWTVHAGQRAVWMATNVFLPPPSDTPSWLEHTVLSSLWFLDPTCEVQTSFPMSEEGLQQSSLSSSTFS